MKHLVLGAVFAAVVLAAPNRAAAHHGAATFDTSREITLQGVVTEWIWSNPHCFLKFDAKDDTGTVRQWAAEVQNPVTMTVRGWSRGSFKAGDQVTITIQPVKSGAPVGRIRNVVLPNGTTLYGEPPATPAPVSR